MKAAEVRAMNKADLEKKLSELKAELFNLRFQHAINQLDNPIRLNEVKKTSQELRPSFVSLS